MYEIFYARHVHDWETETLKGSFIEYLYKKKAIAIHFNGVESWDPQDYEGYRNQGPSAIRYMNRCNTQGDDKYIFASYKIGGKQKILLGKPKAESKCFLREHFGVPKEEPIKLLFLEDDARIVDPHEFPFAFLLAPKQSTFVRWNQCNKIANAYINGDDYDLFDPATYLPWAIENVCEEYLRKKGLLKRKVYKSGGSLKDFDIVGIDDNGKRVAAQVKNRSNKDTVQEFAKTCSSLGDGIYYFFVEGDYELTGYENSHVISLTDVLREFSDECDYLKRLQLAAM